ncbi:MAG: T9SS type A sorting domain-containing protein [Ignavibacteriales bacterium]|nr:T9SS type A sorting domain-containing protein [Ignavibacteriales bacterium]
MSKLHYSLGGKVGSVIVLLIVSFLFLSVNQIIADGGVEVTGSIQVKTDSSITVNSLEFLVNSSTKISGTMGSSLPFDSLKVGSLVKIEAESKIIGKLVATKIRLMTAKINLELNGKITARTTNSITVKGTEVFVDTNTIIFTQFHAALNFADLKVGDSVLVKATQAISGQLTAVAIIVKTENTRQEIELEGKIQAITETSIKVQDTVFFVDSSTIILSHQKTVLNFSDLKVGDEVEVRGFLRQDSTYLALYIRVENEEFEQRELEIEGAISAIASNSITVNMVTFKVDSSTVIYAHEGGVLNFSDLKVGDQVEVKAILLSDSTYKAVRIKLENEESDNELEVAGLIDSVGTDNIIVGGYKIYVNSQTKIYNQFKQSLTFADLKVGTFVVVKANLQNTTYLAATIKVRNNINAESNFTGAIESISGSSITVKGLIFVTDQNTEFLGDNRNTITITDLKVGQIVKIKATLQSGNQYLALRVIAKNFWRPTVKVEGAIENLTLTSITVMGKTFAVDSSTLVVGHGTGVITFASLTLGLNVEVKGSLTTAGVLTAKLIKVHPAHEFEVHGKIDTLSANQFVVAGLTIKTDQNTVYYDEFDKQVTFDSLKVNQLVEVKYVKTVTNENLAVKVEIEKDPHTVQFNGVVTATSANSIRLSIPSFSLTSNTVFISSTYSPVQSASIKVGQSVTVWADQSPSGNLQAVQVQQISAVVTDLEGNKDNLPVSYELKQNYPNPFNPTTEIAFTLANQENVSLVVYNIIGQEVATLISSPMSAGAHTVKFNAANLSSGIYLYRLKAGNFVSIKKMILLK